MRRLGGCVQNVIAGDFVVVPNSTPRFYGAVDGPLVYVFEGDSNFSRPKSKIGCLLVTVFTMGVQIVQNFAVKLRCTVFD